VKGAAVERELAQLAAELGTGRDAALLRALIFYRKFAQRGRRVGRAPEAFLKELLEAFDHRDIHAELAKLREKVASIAERAPVGAGAPAEAPRVRLRQPTPLEVYRAARDRAPLPRGVYGGPDDPARARPAGEAPLEGAPGAMPAGTTVLAAPPPPPGSSGAAALASVLGAATAPAAAAPAPAAPTAAVLGLVVTPAPLAPQAKSDYADRRTRLPKLTF
jgi:hypothetical protein